MLAMVRANADLEIKDSQDERMDGSMSEVLNGAHTELLGFAGGFR
jgi:hypothetical protein